MGIQYLADSIQERIWAAILELAWCKACIQVYRDLKSQAQW
jgi:hypothetical protein